ncbi:MAG: AI-2E family transporter [Deltaproteobacteria bacterium]|nr:AI-2E family transporter [Deltaproteobacteria bacterium]
MPPPEPPTAPPAQPFGWQPLFFKALVLGGSLVGMLWLIARLRVVTAPILIGFFVAYALNPLVVRLQRWRVPPILALTVPVLLVAALLAVFVLVVLPSMAEQFIRASQHTPARIYNYLLRIDPWTLAHLGQKASDLVPYQDLSGMVQALARAVIGPAQSLVTALLSSARDVLLATGKLLLVVVVAFFLLDDYERTVQIAGNLVPRRHLAEVTRIVRRIDDVMAGFVRGQLLLLALATTWLTGSMAALDVPFWLVMGPIAAVVYLVPYVGVLTGLAITVLLQLLGGEPGWHVAGLALAFAAFYTADLLFITPRIIGNRVGLPPLAVLLGIIAFGELFGVIGVLLAVPLLACGRILLLEAVARYRLTAAYLGAETTEAADPSPAPEPR